MKPDKKYVFLIETKDKEKIEALKNYIEELTGTKPGYEEIEKNSDRFRFEVLLNYKEQEKIKIKITDIKSKAKAFLEETGKEIFKATIYLEDKNGGKIPRIIAIGKTTENEIYKTIGWPEIPLPCPCCGGKGRITAKKLGYVYCEECRLRTETEIDIETALETWNRRPKWSLQELPFQKK